jgi:glycosyltransferase involved in cell wall biosynthesis
MYAAHALGIPFGFVGHANDLFENRALLRRKLERAAHVSCISEWHRQWYREIHPDPTGKYKVIRCGVDVDRFRPDEANRAGGLGLRVLTVARLVPKKGVDTLIRAFCRVAGAGGPGWSLTIAGEGPDRERLEALANELGQGLAIDFRGAVSNRLLEELYRNSDVFALPCRTDARGDRDGIPVVLMEAMACGLPVIAGDLPAIRELVVDGESGLVVAGDDEEALAGYLQRLGGDRDERERLGRAGRARVQGEFSLAINGERLDCAIRDVLGRSL